MGGERDLLGKSRTYDPLAPVEEILKRHGARCTPQEFHAAVNVTFHGFESELYDELHRDMWQSLPAQVNLLAEDCLRAGPPERIRMLDIGCGTGLATDCLLKSPLGQRVESVDLLDTSPKMLARAQERRKTWGRPGEAMEGLVESLSNGTKRYNLIIVCSVLHHVPDLASFLKAIADLQRGEGPALFLHLQDPNGDAQSRRPQGVETGKTVPEWLARLHPRRIVGRFMREFKGEQGQDYLSKTNQQLIAQGWITSALTAAEIFTITDIHVQDGEGISTDRMKGWLPDYQLLTRRSYGFFGELWSELSPQLKVQEEELIRQGATDGGHISAAWRRE